MANKNLFKTTSGRAVPVADTTNEAGGKAYSLNHEQALAQFVCTCAFGDAFYSSASDQLGQLKQAAERVSPEFLAKTAVYARQRAYMKDTPAALLAVLLSRSTELFRHVFPRVADNAKMVRNFVQIVRSGQMGRKSLGHAGRGQVRAYLASRSSERLFRDSVGNDPSLADVIKMVHPRPRDAEQRALFGYLLGRAHDAEVLPQVVKDYEAFKAGASDVVPDVEFRMLTSLPLKPEHWAEIAQRGGWQQTRMNLNTYARHGVFELPGMAEVLSNKLKDPEGVRRARVFPYQLLMAYKAADQTLPHSVRDALQDAMEVATENVPEFGGQAHVIVDVSGSMSSPVTGQRGTATTAVRCVDVAGLIASCVLRRNPGSSVLPVDTSVHKAALNPRDTVMTNAQALARFGGGGTDLGAAMVHLNEKKAKGGLIIMVSDCESWVDSSGRGRSWSGGTAVMHEFREYQRRNPGARMVCIDLQPYGTTQAPDAPDEVMNIGGFSDAIWDVIAKFARGTKCGSPNDVAMTAQGIVTCDARGDSAQDASAWVAEIEAVDLGGVAA